MSNNSGNVINSTPLSRIEVQNSFPKAFIQRIDEYSDAWYLEIIDWDTRRTYLEVWSDLYLPVTKNGEDVSDLIEKIHANKSLVFMWSSIAYDSATAELKMIDDKLIGAVYSEPFVKVYNLDGDYIERMILKEGKLIRAKLNGEEVILHDAWHWNRPNQIQFPWQHPVNCAIDLELDEQWNIVTYDGKIYSSRTGIVQEWEVHSNTIKQIWSKVRSDDGEVLSITLLWKDVSKSVSTNSYGTEQSMKFKWANNEFQPIINLKSWEILTYGWDKVLWNTSEYSKRWNTNIAVLYSLDGLRAWAVMFNIESYEVIPLRYNWVDVSTELNYSQYDGKTVIYKWKEMFVHPDDGSLFDNKEWSVVHWWVQKSIRFMWSSLPKNVKFYPEENKVVFPDKYILQYNPETGDIHYKEDERWHIFVDDMHLGRLSWRRKMLLIWPWGKVITDVKDHDLIEKIDALPDANVTKVVSDVNRDATQVL